jgi:hypothetical protein
MFRNNLCSSSEAVLRRDDLRPLLTLIERATSTSNRDVEMHGALWNRCSHCLSVEPLSSESDEGIGTLSKIDAFFAHSVREPVMLI